MILKRNLSIILILFLWQVVSSSIPNADLFLPSIISVVKHILDNLLNLPSLYHILITLYRTILSFLISLSIGVSLGMISILYPSIEHFFRPYELFLKAIPNISYMFLLFLWIPKTSDAIYIILFLILFPLFYTSTLQSAKNLDQDLQDVLTLYNESISNKVIQIYLPQSLSYIQATSISSISLAFKVCVMSEVLGSVKYGIGRMLYFHKLSLNMTGVFAWTILIIVMNYILEKCIEMFCKIVNHHISL
ncbi:MAG: ABC transporter permease subunit [Erysipelotrichales bacterium]|nr:ABC transporter permease subunit [Erysipelotrichales bacterium]